MKLEWMGRYRELLAALVYFGNMTGRYTSTRMTVAEGIHLNAQEYQILEYLLEHETEDANVNGLSRALGIPQSSTSKAVKTLCSYGLAARFRLRGNRKSVIPRPTALGREVYLAVAEAMKNGSHVPFFHTLDALDDETIASLARALRDLTDSTYGRLEPPQDLIPFD